MLLNKRKRRFHSSREKFSLVGMSASWFLVSTYLISVGAGHVSHRWTSSIDSHFDDSFIVFKNVQLRLTLRRVCVSVCVINVRPLINLSLSVVSWCLVCGIGPCTDFPAAIMVVLYSVVG